MPEVSGQHLRNYAPDPARGAEVEQRSPGEAAPAESLNESRRDWLCLASGLVLAAVVYVLLPADLAHGAKLTAATAVLMGLWWMTEAIPIPATALVPLVVFPVLGEDVEFNAVGARYGDSIIFLFMGGFMLALAMQR